MAGALFRAALVANCFRGALPPVDLRAVCLVLAIFDRRVVDTQRSIYHEVQIGLYELPDIAARLYQTRLRAKIETAI